MICASADWYLVSGTAALLPGGDWRIGSAAASSGRVLGVAGKFSRASFSAFSAFSASLSFFDGIPAIRFIFLYAISSGDRFLDADATAASVTPAAAPAAAQRSLADLFLVASGVVVVVVCIVGAFSTVRRSGFFLGGSTDANATAPRGLASASADSFAAALSFFDGIPMLRFTALYARMNPERFFLVPSPTSSGTPAAAPAARHLSLADERESAACVDDSTDGRDPPWCAALDASGRDRAPAGWGAPLLTSSAPHGAVVAAPGPVAWPGAGNILGGDEGGVGLEARGNPGIARDVPCSTASRPTPLDSASWYLLRD